MKLLSKFWFRYHSKRMSELGREIVDTMQDDQARWSMGEHRLVHKQSGLAIWYGGSGFIRIHIEQINGLPYIESNYDDALNRHDKYVIWLCIQAAKQVEKGRPAQEALNALRLSRMKENPQ